MKFVLHSDSNEFLICDSCGGEDFELLPNKKLSHAEKFKSFLFYECPNCRGAGFWTHQQIVDTKQQVGRALARCKMPEQVKSNPAKLERQRL